MNPTNKITRIILTSLTSATALWLASSSPAATYQWTNTAATAAFVNPANWTNTASPFGNGTPVAGDVGINNIPGAAAVIGLGDVVVAATLDALSGTISVTDGDLTATSLRATGTNGVVAISGGTVNLANLQITGNYGILSISGGTTTVTTDSRIGANNAIWNVSGGSLNLSKHSMGTANTSSTNNIMTVSGNAVVTQNQGTSGGVNRELWVGGNNGGSGTLILKDNASWVNSAANGSTDVILGRTSASSQSPVGTLTVQDNASLVVQAGGAAAKVIQLAGGPNDGATGIVNLNGGNISTIGLLRARSGTSTGVINANGGKFTALADNASFFRNLPGSGGNNSVNLLAGGLTFDTDTFAVTVTNVLSGAGGLTKLGSGTLTFTASNTFTGGTIVSNGTLALTGIGSVKSSPSLAINTATLDVASANPQLSFPGSLTLNDATISASFVTTNITVGTLATGGTTNVINVTALPIITSVPTTVRLIKYTTAAPGLVDGGNVLTSLGVILPTIGSPVGYLTNNAGNSSVDLVITSMVLAPVITGQPAPDSAYTNFLAHFSVELESTNSPGYQWRKGGVPLSDGGHYEGVTTAVLKISSASSADIANYDVVVTNVSGGITSSPAALTLVAPYNGYESAALAAVPAALYMFDETGDPIAGNLVAFDYAGDVDGIYGSAAQNGFNSIPGPRPSDSLPGFDSTNIAARCFGFTAQSRVAVAPLNLNTNTVTITAWINPVTPTANAGIVFCRGGSTVAGLNVSGGLDPSNTYRTLGYTWNNDAGTFGWNSQIAPTPGQWSFVALVVTPTNATIYIFDAAGMRASSQAHTHANQSFSASTLIGEDSFAGNRQFDGTIDGVGIYGKSLSQAALQTLYGAASGVSNFPPVIWLQPAAQTRYEHQTASFNVQASGNQPLSYQWKYFDGLNYTDVNNGGRVSGATSSSLSISNLALTDVGDLVVVITNTYGAQTSSVATLAVNANIGPATNITTSIVQPSTSDWDTDGTWSLPGSAANLSGEYFGSTFIVQAPGGLRTPNFGNPASPTFVAFPGELLRVEGNGTFDGSFTTAGGIRIKGGNPSTVYFKKLEMAGGQICNILNNGWSGILTGEISVISNTVVWAADDSSPRSITIQSTLTGNGNITYHAYNNFTTLQTSSSASLNIANADNSFTGAWNVELGALVGSAASALGTNSITVGAQGALQTTYNVNNTNGSLVLNGRMYLTQNDTFRTVTINGVGLTAGTYSFAQLNASHPANFPATWVGLNGAESFTSGSGSITVLDGAVTPILLTNSWNGLTLTLSWPAGWSLLEATNVIGPWTTNLSASSPFPVSPTEPQKFFRLQNQ